MKPLAQFSLLVVLLVIGRAATVRGQGSPGFSFPADNAGKLLQERLTPRQVSLGPSPYAVAPQATAASRAERAVLRQLWVLPAAEVPFRPRLTAQDFGSESRALPAVDLPALAMLELQRPSQPVLAPGTPLSFAAAPRVEMPLPLPAFGRPTEGRPELSFDPTRQFARDVALRPALAGHKPAPFLKLAVPDPFENRLPAAALTPGDDLGQPAVSRTVPARPLLPVTP